MGKITLSPEELMVLSSFLDAETFYGIADPFEDMTVQQIWAQIPDILNSAARKGLLSMGFDDSVNIKKDVKKLLSLCINCDSYTRIRSADDLVNKVIYKKDGSFALLEALGNDLSLEEKEPDEIIKALQSEIFANLLKVSKEEASLKREALEELKKDGKITASLKETWLSDEMLLLILKAFNNAAQYISMVIIDVRDGASCEAALIKDEDRALKLCMDADLLGESFSFSWLSSEEAEKILTELIKGEEE